MTNAYGVSPEKLGGQPSSKFVAQAFAGARLVKGFNHLVAAVLEQDPAVQGGRRVVFLASDDDGAAEKIGELAENLGFAPIKLGGLSEGGLGSTGINWMCLNVLFFINVASRSVHIGGITPHPENGWMAQVARNVTDTHDGFLRDNRYLIMDRDTKYSDAFRGIITRAGTNVVRLPPRSPNLNAFAERFVRSIKEECRNRMIFVSQASLRHAIGQYLTHYHSERNHQGLGNRLLIPSGGVYEPCVPVKRRERLGGMLSYYHREAASTWRRACFHSKAPVPDLLVWKANDLLSSTLSMMSSNWPIAE